MLTLDCYAGRSLLIEDAALVLGVSRRTVYYWIRDGRLETVRTPGGSQRVLMASIKHLVRGRDTVDGAEWSVDGAASCGSSEVPR